jgi:NADH:ubiquinone oxidoreductase subunit E
MSDDIKCCQGRWCRELGGPKVLEKLQEENKYSDTVVQPCKCLGYCEQGANVLLDNEAIIHGVTEENVFDKIGDISEHREYKKEEELEIEDTFLGDI